MNTEQRTVLDKIKKIDEQIASLNNYKARCLAQVQSLSQLLIDQPVPLVNNQSSNKSYFRGREDVYTKLWVNNRTGKRGYSPVCKHEWDRVLCRKPAIKCSECPNQGFLPMDELAISQHLSGAQVIAIYSMLKNENCYFLTPNADSPVWTDCLACDKNRTARTPVKVLS